MDPFTLLEEQVEFELKRRGASTDGSPRLLASRLNLNILLATECKVVPVSVENELDYCVKLLAKLEADLEVVRGRRRTAKVLGIQSQIIHIINRLRNVQVIDPTSAERVDSLVAVARELTSRVELSFVSEENQEDSESDGPTPPRPELRKRRNAIGGDPPIVPRELSSEPVYKWRMKKFDGRETQWDVHEFLLEVEEKAQTRNVSHDQLFRESAELFDGEALVWYRDAAQRVSSWEDLRRELLIAYQGYGNDGHLREQIRATKQEDSQGIDVFLAKMRGMYRRLDRQVSEEEQLDEILRNLNPFLKDRLMMVRIDSIADLRKFARQAESARTRLGTEAPSPVLVSSRDRRTNVSAVREQEGAQPATSRDFQCYNCNSKTHSFRYCDAPMKKFCYGCGMPDVTRSSCPRCAAASKNAPAVAGLEADLIQLGPNCSVAGLADSGAQTSIISEGLLGSLTGVEFGRYAVPVRLIQTADGASHPVRGGVDLPIIVDGEIRPFPVLVARSLAPPLILGMDFLKHFGVTINFAEMGPVPAISDPVESCALITEHQLPQQLRPAVERIRARLEQLARPDSEGRLRATTIMQHHISLMPGSLPVKQRVRPVSEPVKRELWRQLDELRKQGVVEPSQSPWCSPLVLQKKKNGTYRMCHDSRKVNEMTIKDSYPLPHIQSTLDLLRNAKFISSIDLKSAFFQVPLTEASKPVTAFAVPGRGLWQFTRMPFGLANSGPAFQRLCDQVIAGLENVFGYLDDLIMVSSTAEEHVRLLNEVLDRLEQANLTINAEKCELFRSALTFLGFVVDASGLRAAPDKISAIIDFPRMKTQREVRRFLGICGYYRRFVPSFSKVASPLTDLLRKGKKFDWTLECEQAFAQLKTLLTSSPVMAVPNFELPFVVQTDASVQGLGAVLTQRFHDGEKVIAYASRKLTGLERAYTATELECLAVLFAVERFRPYLEGCRFTVITDHHALKWLKEIKDPNPRLTRWALKLQAHDYDIEYRKGSMNLVPDALSRAPVSGACALRVVPDEVRDPWYARMVGNVTASPENYPLWRVQDGRLFKFLEERDQLVNSWKLVVPRELRQETLVRCHNAPEAGHFGVLKTLKRIAADYYWPKMRVDVQRFVSGCPVCAAFKPSNVRPAGLMGQHSVRRQWQCLAIDFSGKYPRSPRRNEYLLSVQCLFSKFILLFPMTNCRAANMVRLLKDKVFSCFGVPEELVCDNGSQFTSREFVDAMRERNIRIKYTALYHPQADPVERAHRELKRMMGSTMQGNTHARWDEFLPEFQLAINSAVSETTKFAPASLLFNHRVCAVNRDLAEASATQISPPDAVARADRFRQEEIIPVVQANIHRQFERNKARYDAGRRPVQYDVGDRVWHRAVYQSSAQDKFSKKLAPKFVGPFVIDARHGRVVYSLKDAAGRGVGKWHVQDLRPDQTAARDHGVEDD
ncbi:unnamed protein product [Nesidiocoris tenuis]|uniref:RNA-directed DNA polymerase n=1 Tax=Nesidiocoris tenuis TaxID=355587 RepID=A0A6H5HGS3_9HEMI|nr:unnamed protein product [Nesidiocoris tenuis]